MRRGSTARPQRAPSPRAGEGGFERLFWEYPAGSVRLDTDRDLVVRRVVAEGGLREMRLLRSRYNARLRGSRASRARSSA